MVNIENYIDMVHKLTRKRYRQFSHKYKYEDLFQIGCTGLMMAAKNFDTSKGTKFSTFAYNWIDKYILKCIRDDKWYIATNRNERYTASPPNSLDEFITNSDNVFNKSTYLSKLVDETDYYELSDFRMLIVKLPDNLKTIIKLRYFDDFTQTQVANILNVSQMSISRREKKALSILRKEMIV